ACKWQYVSVVVSGYAEMQGCASCGKHNNALLPRDPTHKFDTKPRCTLKRRKLFRESRVEHVTMICGELPSLDGKAHSHIWGVSNVNGRYQRMFTLHLNPFLRWSTVLQS